MREELLNDIEARKPIAVEAAEGTTVGGSTYHIDPFTSLSPWNKEDLPALLLRDIAKSLRILIELQLENLSESGS